MFQVKEGCNKTNTERRGIGMKKKIRLQQERMLKSCEQDTYMPNDVGKKNAKRLLRSMIRNY